MSTDLMRYDRMVEGAMRGVMIEALRRAADKGLPGDHHFYISFRTDHPEVEIGPALRARYAEEMTIVLQHQFWNLDVGNDRFSVTLSFNQVHETLVVPYAAITAFADPSVKFGLQFHNPDTVPSPATETKEAEVERLNDGGRHSPTGKTTRGGKKAASGKKAPSDAPAEVVALDSFRKK